MSTKKGWFASLFGWRDDEGKRHEGDSGVGAKGQPDAAPSGDWQSGQTVLDDFVIERVLGEGGMGKVYLLKSQTTGTLFAVKRAKGLSERDRRNFFAELQTWIDLPEHPNLVPCRFFRTVENEVLIFAEYVDGGSLKDWIDSRKLYEGGAEKTLERILDTAIQFAWGLHCVHELGLVHQDVKPANVMMEKDAQVAVQGLKVRVTDYGLARARAASGEQYVPEIGQSILVSSGGYTPAYCSPEQADGRKLDRRTDVWSWGVSVMEMFQGGVTWHSGKVAAQALESILENNGEEAVIPAMPAAVAELLAQCFRQDPAQRCQSLEAVVQNLKGVYQAAVGTEYLRALGEIEQRPAPQTGADERRTWRGTSWTDPRTWLEMALRAEGRDPGEAAEIVARQASSRRGQLVADMAAYDEARRMFERLITGGRNDLENGLAMLCHDAASVHSAADDSSGALAMYDRAIEIRERLVNVEGRRELANELADLYGDKAVAVCSMGDYRTAIGLYDRAIQIRERIVNVEGQHESAKDLAALYMNKGVAVKNLGDIHAAMVSYDRAIELLEQLAKGDDSRKLSSDLASLYTNKANGVLVLGDNRAAVGLYDRAIEILERLVNIEDRRELANDLVGVYMNKAVAVKNLGDYQAAAELNGRAIEILERLVNVEGRNELANDLAYIYTNKARVVFALGDEQAAMGLHDRATEMLERLVNVEGRRELAHDLAGLYQHKAGLVGVSGDNRAAVNLYDRAIKIFDRLVNVQGHNELLGDLAWVKADRGLALIQLGDTKAGKREARDAMTVLRAEVIRTGRADLKEALDSAAKHLGEP